jgi:hypothetical protein
MADVKLTALPAAASVSTDDIVPIVDLADTTTKKATVTQVRAAIVPVAVATEVSGLGAGVATFLTTPNNANFSALAGIVQTGSGNFVFSTSPTLTTPRIAGTTPANRYVFAVNDIAADRTVTIPLLTGNDTFVFAAHAETLTNKTIDADANTITNIEDADIKAAAAIAGSKVTPDFGAQAIVTTGSISLGATPATAGDAKLINAFAVKGRNAANSANLTALAGNASNALFLACSSAFNEAWTTLQIFPSTTLNLGIGSTTKWQITTSGAGTYNTGNLGVYGNSTSFPAVGGGVGVFAMGNCNTVPSSNPTNGVVHYSEAGAAKVRGASGTITTYGAADLDGFKSTSGNGHCPACGTDFAVEWSNDAYGGLTVCMRCLADELGDRPWIVKRKPQSAA